MSLSATPTAAAYDSASSAAFAPASSAAARRPAASQHATCERVRLIILYNGNMVTVSHAMSPGAATAAASRSVMSFLASHSLLWRAPCVSSHRVQHILFPIDLIFTGRKQNERSQHGRRSSVCTYLSNARDVGPPLTRWATSPNINTSTPRRHVRVEVGCWVRWRPQVPVELSKKWDIQN